MSVLVIGSTNIDISIRVNRFPKKGETLLGSDISYKYGGKGANQACALGKLGGDVTFLTCVGEDAHGHVIQKELLWIFQMLMFQKLNTLICIKLEQLSLM